MQRTFSQTLKSLAFAYFLLCFDINFGTVNILPNWWGYMLISTELANIAQRQPSALLLKNFVTILTAVAAVEWVAKIFGITVNIYFLHIFITVIYAYTHFQLLTNIADIAAADNMPYYKQLTRSRNGVILSYTATIVMNNFTLETKFVYRAAIVNMLFYIYLIWQLFLYSAELEDKQAEKTIENMEV